MRVALLIYGSLETLSGGYLYDRMLVERLRRQGDAVEVISLPWRDYLRHLGDNFSPRLLRRLERLEADVLLQDELNHPSLFWLNGALRARAACPIVAIVHHLRSSEARPSWQNRLYRLVERRYLAGVDGFICNSRTTRQAVQALAGIEQPYLEAYPGGDRLHASLSEGQIAGRALQPGPLRVLFVGNVILRKGLHTLVEALRRVPRPLWRLDVIGSLEMERAYAQAARARVRALGLSEQVRFHGPLSEGELARQMQASHLLAVPSSYEGFGISYLEGMGFGLPAIASTSGAAHEIVTHGQDGFLLPAGDAGALAECLRRLAEDRPLLLQMSVAARRRYQAHPTWEETTGRIRRFLQGFALHRPTAAHAC